MTIRNYESDDFGGVVSLWEKCFSYPAPHNNPRDSIRRKMSLKDNLFFVALNSRSEIAATVMAGYDGHRGWIYSLAVSEALRRQGLGKAMVEHAVKELKKRDCPKVNLQVMPDNPEAVGFYQKLGFVVEERTSMGLKLY